MSVTDQGLVDARVEQLLDEPEAGSNYDAHGDLWTTTDEAGAGISYAFRIDRPRLFFRLNY